MSNPLGRIRVPEGVRVLGLGIEKSPAGLGFNVVRVSDFFKISD